MSQQSVFFRREPHWQTARRSLLPSSSVDSLSWLLESGSVTARLRRSCREQLVVVVLRQGWGNPFWSEACTFGLAPGRTALVREVVLKDGPLPLVLARTVIPRAVLRGRNRRLSVLGDRPLGEVLFADPELRRDNLECCRLSKNNWISSSLENWQAPQEVWGRRNLYSLCGVKLLVAEFFLPAVLDLDK